MAVRISMPQRFWGKVDKTPGQGPKGHCWVWTAGKDKDGYGKIKINQKHFRTHRIAYELQIQKIPEGMLVCHTCDHPACVRGSHLFIGTFADNNADTKQKGKSSGGKTGFLNRKIGPENTSWCSKCKTFKAVENFHRGKRWTGFSVICKPCTAERDRIYLAKIKEKTNASRSTEESSSSCNA